MANELALNEGFDREKIDLIKKLVASDCSDVELELFLYTCKKTGLDPLARQIYAIKRGGKMTIQTGIDGYRVIADRTGKLAGISDYAFARDEDTQKYPSTASVTVKKLLPNDSLAEFTATARWGEYNAGGSMWQKMPYLMLGKCAEALALRKAFPADLSGVYTQEEMEQADNPARDAVFAEVERQKQSAYWDKDSQRIEEPVVGRNPSIASATVALPPELDWSYNKGSGILICRPEDVKTGKTKAQAEYIAVKLNNAVEGKSFVSYFHKSHTAELLGAKGKVCKFSIVPAKGGYYNIDAVLEIDGNRMIDAEPDNSPETQCRLIASNLDWPEEQLRECWSGYCKGNWAMCLEVLREAKERAEVTA